MIGCDGCDSWLHWTYVGITREPPADEEWFCPTCVKSRQTGKKKARKRKKKLFVKYFYIQMLINNNNSLIQCYESILSE